MKFKITKASDWSYTEEKDIDTLEELFDYINRVGRIVVEPAIEGYKNLPEIVIYDDYIE